MEYENKYGDTEIQKTIEIYNQKINDIINSWINLNNVEIILDLSFCNLNILPKIPINVKHLYVSNNNLKELNNLPNLISLKCDFNNLSSLILPNSLTHLICNNNNLKILNLPNNLISLKCDDNELSSLILPLNLKFCDCNENEIKELILPKSLKSLYCNFNKIKSLILPPNIKNIIVDNFVKINNYNILIENNTVDINNFNFFYNKNIENCFLKNTYPPNYDNIKKWNEELSKFRNINLKIFGYCITKTLMHISFKEFYDTVCKLGYKLAEFMNILLSEDSDIHFYFYIPNVNKSNLWVLLLIWKFLKIPMESPLIEDKFSKNPDGFPSASDNFITNNIKIITDTNILSNKNYNNNYKIIYIDDCSYTGTQILETIQNIYDKTYVFIPFISNNALEKLQNNKIKIYYVNIFYNFNTLLSQSEKQSYNNVLDIYDTYRNSDDLFNENICNIYFDHKLADFVSVFQPIYAYGRIPSANEINIDVGSFIGGCENFYKTNVIQFKSIDLQGEFVEICPVAYYKTIKYDLLNILNDKLN